jgi:hypothetical protein
MRQTICSGIFGRGLGCALAVAVTLSLGGCRGRAVRNNEAAGTNIATGDMLSGRLAVEAPAQTFTFEGVESSLLDFTLRSDELNRSAPTPVLTDPEGKTIELVAHRTSPHGAATSTYEGVLLMRTGTHTLSLASTDRTADSWYIFQHKLRFPSIIGDTARLDETATYPISFTAPYGATVSVRVRPSPRSSLKPDIRGVVDPSGGRALDAGQTPGGVLPPQAAPTIDGGLTLVFVTPRAGRYTVLASAKPGTSGEALIDVDVTPPNFDRAIWHPGSDPLAPAMPAVPMHAPRTSAQLPAPPTAFPPAAPQTAQPPVPSAGFPAPASFPAASPAPAPDAWSAPPADIAKR